MTYNQIGSLQPLNKVDADKVAELVADMLVNGWVGCPILVMADSGLITGSHRLAALQTIAKMVEDEEIESALVLSQDVAEDVTDLVEDAFHRAEEETGEMPDMEYDNLGWIFEGTWVDAYKDEIIEW